MDKTKKIAKSTAALVIFALIGKLFGFARETLMAYYFGAGMETDAFVISLNAVSLLSLPLSSSIATTFIPMLARVEQEEGAELKQYHTNNMLSLTSILGAIIAGLGIILAPWIIKLVGGGFDEEAYTLAVELTKIGMPVIIFSAIVGVMTGYLQSSGRFAATGAVAIPLNIVYISYMVFLSGRYGIYGMSVASVLGILAQVIFLFPDTLKAKMKYFPVFDIKDKYVMHAISLCLPVILSIAINDVNMVVSRRLASGLAEGTVSWLNYANKLNTLILGVFISAITAVIFPILSKAFSSGDIDGGKKSMGSAVRFIILITLPSMVGLMVLSQPIVEIAFMRGKFLQFDADITSVMLKLYSSALCAMSLNTLLNRVYYSLQDTRTPLMIGAFSVVLNIILNLILIRFLNYYGLPLAYSIATNIAVFTGFVLLKNKLGTIGGYSYLRSIIKSGVAAAIMGVVAYISFYGVLSLIPALGNGTLTKLILLLLSVGCSVIVYGVLCYLFGVREVKMVVNTVLKRLKRG